MPVPPPSDLNCAQTSRRDSAATQLPIAKYGPSSRNSSGPISAAMTAVATAAIAMEETGSRLPRPIAANRTEAPSPTNACCPTDTRPPHPASTFHNCASVRMVNTKNRSCSSVRGAMAGSRIRPATAARPAMRATRESRVSEVARQTVFAGARAGSATSDRCCGLSSIMASSREQAARPYHQHGEKGEVTGKNLPLRIDPRADRLRDADNDAARECAPQASQPADDHGLEGGEQPGGTHRWIEISADAQRNRGDDRYRERNAHRDRIDPPLIDSHQLSDLGIVGGGAERPPYRGSVEQELQQRDRDHGGDQRGQRRKADRQSRCKRYRRGFERAGLKPPAVGTERQEQRVLHDHRQAERHQQRWHDVVAEDAIENETLQQITENEHCGDGKQCCGAERQAGHAGREQYKIGCEHDQIAVRKIDEPHNAENQRKPEREQPVDSTEQNSLRRNVEPVHDQAPNGSGSKIRGGDRAAVGLRRRPR